MKKVTKILLAVLVAFVGMSLAACSDDDESKVSLVGKWVSDTPSGDKYLIINVKDGKTFEMMFRKFNDDSGKWEEEIDKVGTYTYKDNMITLSYRVTHTQYYGDAVLYVISLSADKLVVKDTDSGMRLSFSKQ